MIRETLGNVCIQNAQATHASDRAMIMQIVAPRVDLEDAAGLTNACKDLNTQISGKLKLCFARALIDFLKRNKAQPTENLFRLCGSVVFFLAQEKQFLDGEDLFAIYNEIGKTRFASSREYACLLKDYGNLLRAQKKHTEAMQYIQQGQKILSMNGHLDTLDYADILHGLGIQYALTEPPPEVGINYKKASHDTLMESKVLYERLGAIKRADYANCLKCIGIGCSYSGQLQDAEIFYNMSKEAFQNSNLTKTPWYADLLQSHARLLQQRAVQLQEEAQLVLEACSYTR